MSSDYWVTIGCRTSSRLCATHTLCSPPASCPHTASQQKANGCSICSTIIVSLSRSRPCSTPPPSPTAYEFPALCRTPMHDRNAHTITLLFPPQHHAQSRSQKPARYGQPPPDTSLVDTVSHPKALLPPRIQLPNWGLYPEYSTQHSPASQPLLPDNRLQPPRHPVPVRLTRLLQQRIQAAHARPTLGGGAQGSGLLGQPRRGVVRGGRSAGLPCLLWGLSWPLVGLLLQFGGLVVAVWGHACTQRGILLIVEPPQTSLATP